MKRIHVVWDGRAAHVFSRAEVKRYLLMAELALNSQEGFQVNRW